MWQRSKKLSKKLATTSIDVSPALCLDTRALPSRLRGGSCAFHSESTTTALSTHGRSARFPIDPECIISVHRLSIIVPSAGTIVP